LLVALLVLAVGAERGLEARLRWAVSRVEGGERNVGLAFDQTALTGRALAARRLSHGDIRLSFFLAVMGEAVRDAFDRTAHRRGRPLQRGTVVFVVLSCH